jgi:hypothetical protein
MSSTGTTATGTTATGTTATGTTATGTTATGTTATGTTTTDATAAAATNMAAASLSQMSSFGTTMSTEDNKILFQAMIDLAVIVGYIRSVFFAFFGSFTILAAGVLLALSGYTVLTWLFVLGAVLELIIFYWMRYSIEGAKTPLEMAKKVSSIATYIPVQMYMNFASIILAIIMSIVKIFSGGTSSAPATLAVPAAVGGRRRR